MSESKLFIQIASGGLAQTNAYLVADRVAKVAVLIDAPDHTVGPLLAEVAKQGWTLAALWLTHGHFDHLADHAVVREQFPDARILIHVLERPRLQNPHSRMFALPFVIPPGQPDALVADNDTLSVGRFRAEVLFTPGHAPGHVAYYFKEQKVLFGGDLIIGGAIGRTDFPDCSVPDMSASLLRICALPDDTQIFPGHGDPSTLGEEKASNPYLRRLMRDGTLPM